MTIFKTTQEIIDSSWKKNDDTYIYSSLPKQFDWLKEGDPKIEDIKLWEQIYREPGNSAIYACWSPFSELYIIINEVFVSDLSTWEIFSGKKSAYEVLKRSKELGIDVEIQPVWIPSWNIDKIDPLGKI